MSDCTGIYGLAVHCCVTKLLCHQQNIYRSSRFSVLTWNLEMYTYGRKHGHIRVASARADVYVRVHARASKGGVWFPARVHGQALRMQKNRGLFGSWVCHPGSAHAERSPQPGSRGTQKLTVSAGPGSPGASEHGAAHSV